MSPAVVLIIVIGVPLILIAVGFVVLATKVFSGGDRRVERAQTLEAARQLERTLTALETRLGALEDIILSSDSRKGGGDHD